MKLCAITDRLSLSSPARLLELAEDWAAGGVEFIQLREKDLDASQLTSLARLVKARIAGSRSKLLINISSPEAGIASPGAGISASEAAELGFADGVHLAGKPRLGAAGTVRRQFPGGLVSMPCHSLEDVHVAVAEQADLLLFSPVFEKGAAPPQGIPGLRRACDAARGIPVYALGGVSSVNAPACIAAGAAGVAGIRLFAGGDWRRLHDI